MQTSHAKTPTTANPAPSQNALDIPTRSQAKPASPFQALPLEGIVTLDARVGETLGSLQTIALLAIETRGLPNAPFTEHRGGSRER